MTGGRQTGSPVGPAGGVAPVSGSAGVAGREQLLGGRVVVDGEDRGRSACGRHRRAGRPSRARRRARRGAGAADPPDDGRCQDDDRGDDRDQQQRPATALLPGARPAAVGVVRGGQRRGKVAGLQGGAGRDEVGAGVLADHADGRQRVGRRRSAPRRRPRS